MSECVQISNATRPKLGLPFAIGSVSPLIGACLQPVVQRAGLATLAPPLEHGLDPRAYAAAGRTSGHHEWAREMSNLTLKFMAISGPA